MALDLTDEEILRIAARHCEFSGEGNYHLRRYSGVSAIVTVVRECFDLAELCRQAEAAPAGAQAPFAFCDDCTTRAVCKRRATCIDGVMASDAPSQIEAAARAYVRACRKETSDGVLNAKLEALFAAVDASGVMASDGAQPKGGA